MAQRVLARKLTSSLPQPRGQVIFVTGGVFTARDPDFDHPFAIRTLGNYRIHSTVIKFEVPRRLPLWW